MPFPRAPHPDLLQWDHSACEPAAAAQLLYMGGRLQYPFDTARFDRLIKRQPRQPAANAESLRLIAKALPVVIFSFGRVATQDFLNPKVVRKGLRSFGYSNSEIAEYLRGPYFRLNQQRVRDYLQVERELGNRYRRHICPDSSRYIGDYLRRGAVVSTTITGVPVGHIVLLIPRPARRKAIPVTLYNPNDGLQETSLDNLVAEGEIELDKSGFMAYLMR